MISDLALHHFINIRLIDATAEDIEAVTHQLGVRVGHRADDPDITVRFVERLVQGNTIRHLVMGEAGFTDDAFIVQQNGQRASIALDQIGKRCEIVCESGTAGVPFLMHVVNLTALAKGFMPVHASAFQYNGVGALASGWPKGGKTSTLFAFMSHGAQFMSDDWLYIDREGLVYPLLQPVKLHDWQLENLPQFRSRIPAKKLRTMRLAKAADSVERKMPTALSRRFPPAKAYRLFTRYLNKKQRHVYISPLKLFGDCVPMRPAAFQTLFMTLSHERSDIVVEEISVDEALNKLVFSLLYEWQEFITVYIQFRYAFPEKANPLIDDLQDRQRELLASLLKDKQIYAVNHPHPVPLEALNQALAPYIAL
jgi:hypothetical protein